jgi:hypothetical protein
MERNALGPAKNYGSPRVEEESACLRELPEFVLHDLQDHEFLEGLVGYLDRGIPARAGQG